MTSAAAIATADRFSAQGAEFRFAGAVKRARLWPARHRIGPVGDRARAAPRSSLYTKAMFDQMRDTYSKAPARSGYRVEHVSGLGDDAYFVIDKSRAQLVSLAGSNALTTSPVAATIR